LLPEEIKEFSNVVCSDAVDTFITADEKAKNPGGAMPITRQRTQEVLSKKISATIFVFPVL
jgi:hypothetical protein